MDEFDKAMRKDMGKAKQILKSLNFDEQSIELIIADKHNRFL
jgi:hypothetical protein